MSRSTIALQGNRYLPGPFFYATLGATADQLGKIPSTNLFPIVERHAGDDRIGDDEIPALREDLYIACRVYSVASR